MLRCENCRMPIDNPDNQRKLDDHIICIDCRNMFDNFLYKDGQKPLININLFETYSDKELKEINND